MSEAMSRFVQAAEKLPVAQGHTWRAARFEVTDPVTTDAPIPTSRNLRVATENLTAESVHLIVTTHGRDIAPLSAHPAEEETVLLPGARLVPASALHEVAGLRVQVVIEQPSPNESLPPVPSDEEIAALIETARAAGEVTVTSPGRFGA